MTEKQVLETIKLALSIASKMLAYLKSNNYIALLRYVHKAKHEVEKQLIALEDK